MRKRPTKTTKPKALVTINTSRKATRFAVPVAVLKQLQQELAQFAITAPEEQPVPWRDVLLDPGTRNSEPGVMLRASRQKAGLSQVELAAKLGIPQPNLSAMETGRRAIGRGMAKRLAVVFKTDYRMFV